MTNHRPHDVYEYIAVQDIAHGGVLAFRAGDPVPADNAERLDYISQGLVVTPDEYARRGHGDTAESAEESRPMVRGEMPPHLRPPETAGDGTSGNVGQPIQDDPDAEPSEPDPAPTAGKSAAAKSTGTSASAKGSSTSASAKSKGSESGK